MGANAHVTIVLRTAALATAVFAATFSASADAREPLYGALTDPELLKCETTYWTGSHAEAQTCYRGLLGAAAAVRAEALWALI